MVPNDVVKCPSTCPPQRHLCSTLLLVLCPPNTHPSATAQSPSSSDDSNDEDDKDSKSEDESDSSDDTFVKENYYSSSSVWRSYTTRGQVKGNKEGGSGALSGSRVLRFAVFLISVLPATGSQDSKDGLNTPAKGTDDDKPPSMPEETGKSKVASWLTSQGLKKVRAELLVSNRTELCVHTLVRCNCSLLQKSKQPAPLSRTRVLEIFPS